MGLGVLLPLRYQADTKNLSFCFAAVQRLLLKRHCPGFTNDEHSKQEGQDAERDLSVGGALPASDEYSQRHKDKDHENEKRNQ